MFIYKYEGTISDYIIEQKARDLGMRYEDERKVSFGKDDEE